MRPFHPPRPNPNQHHRARPGGDPGPPHLPSNPMHPAFPPPVPNLAAAAANPMAAAAAAANPFLALQLLGQAQQLQNLGFLAAALQQQQQQQQQAPFFPGGFPANPNQFAPFAGGAPPVGFNGGGAFRPGGAGFCGPRPPSPMMRSAGTGSSNNNAGSSGAARPILNVARKDHNSKAGSGGTGPILDVGRNDRNSSAGINGEVYHFENKADGISNFASESGNKIRDHKSGFSAGRDGRGGRHFGTFRGRGRGRHPNQSRGRESNNWGSSAPGHCSDFPALASGGRQKPPPIVYDANEVKRWVEARKKNYPTSVNVSKKLSEKSDNESKDKDAQLRRQELKEVLAKQQELGFELPELPPGYLSETVDQCIENKNNRKTQYKDSRFGNRFNNNNKRPRYERGGFQSKRSKVWNRTPRTDDAMAKSREPTLLQKLFSSDIKKDRHRLLHVFKFMTLNNFFKDWPDKALQFPSVKVNQIEIGSNISTDDLENAEMANDSILGVNENGDWKELSSIDEEETDSATHNDEDDDGVSADSGIEDGAVEDADEEQCNVPEDDTAA